MASLADRRHSAHEDSGHRDEPLEVLLVEDCAVNALLAQTFLRQLRHRVTRVANGRDALERFASRDFDVVLLDLQLPEMDGFEVAASIRSSCDRSKRVPIVAVTALADIASVQKLHASGMDGYLEKPLRLPVLETMLLRVLRSATPEPVLPHVSGERLDRGALLDEVDGDSALLARMIELFREQSAEQLESLRVALDHGDAKAVGSAAHALKGGIANFERNSAYTSAARLESLAASASLEAAPAEYMQLLGELRALGRDLDVLESSLVETALEEP